MSRSKTKFIINPKAGNGKLLKQWHKFQTEAIAGLGVFDYTFTEKVGHATQVANQALNENYETLVAVGGDGTINEVVNGFFENGKKVNEDARLAIVSMGTGSDFVRTVGMPIQLRRSLQIIKAQKKQACDLGKAIFRARNGEERTRYFINMAGAGFSGAVVAGLGGTRKRLSPKLIYLSSVVKTLFHYESQFVRVQVDGHFDEEIKALAILISNGKYCGGGMLTSPMAALDNGEFSVVIVSEIKISEGFLMLKKLYDGSLYKDAKVKIVQGRKVSVSTQTEVLTDADGEIFGRLPMTCEILPRAINVIC